MAEWDNDTPVTNPHRKDPDFRLGMLMRDLADLQTKHESLLDTVIDLRRELDNFRRQQHASIRPQQIKTAGVSIFVAAVVTGVVEGLSHVLGGILPH